MSTASTVEEVKVAARKSRVVWWATRVVGVLVGVLLGTFLGFFVTMAIFVAQARQGIYLFSLDDISPVHWEAVPTYLGSVAGGWAGWHGRRVLVPGAGFAVAGALLLAIVGWFVGSWLWPETSGPWAGAVMAAALGIVAGVAAAGVRIARDEEVGSVEEVVEGEPGPA
ncbi:MAG TPA: hypothetical protein VK858_13455 [Longimicrobiales bacterium]|nr:hypothetical protein [Longimicrobiales bacterium]